MILGMPAPVLSSKFIAQPGEVVFTTTGVQQWVVPAGVYSVCVVCVGPGGTGTANNRAAGGGGLAWANDLPVTPGETIQILVGAPGTASHFRSAAYLCGGSGAGVSSGFPGSGGGGSFGTARMGGGNGGGGGENGNTKGGGGGGAAGYSGNGGEGTSSSGTATTTPAGGGGGGGGLGGGGGGVSLFGEGASGVAGSFGAGGSGGSGGSAGGAPNYNTNVAGIGGLYGGGGAKVNAAGAPSAGREGAVRVLWGEGRSFPFNAAAI